VTTGIKYVTFLIQELFNIFITDFNTIPTKTSKKEDGH